VMRILPRLLTGFFIAVGAAAVLVVLVLGIRYYAEQPDEHGCDAPPRVNPDDTTDWDEQYEWARACGELEP
jgi:hypothetical protein